MHRAYGITESSLSMPARPFYKFNRLLQIADIVQRIEDAENVDTKIC